MLVYLGVLARQWPSGARSRRRIANGEVRLQPAKIPMLVSWVTFNQLCSLDSLSLTRALGLSDSRLTQLSQPPIAHTPIASLPVLATVVVPPVAVVRPRIFAGHSLCGPPEPAPMSPRAVLVQAMLLLALTLASGMSRPWQGVLRLLTNRSAARHALRCR